MSTSKHIIRIVSGRVKMHWVCRTTAWIHVDLHWLPAYAMCVLGQWTNTGGFGWYMSVPNLIKTQQSVKSVHTTWGALHICIKINLGHTPDCGLLVKACYALWYSIRFHFFSDCSPIARERPFSPVGSGFFRRPCDTIPCVSAQSKLNDKYGDDGEKVKFSNNDKAEAFDNFFLKNATLGSSNASLPNFMSSVNSCKLSKITANQQDGI